MRTLLSTIAMSLAASAAMAQTLNIVSEGVTYQFPAAQTGEMTFAGGTSLSVMGKTFDLADVTAMYTDETPVTDNQVSIAYDGTSASVVVAGNVAQYVTPTVSGAHVTIAQSNTDAVDGDEITYTLSGTSADGDFQLSGSYKCTVSLSGLTLNNPSGAAINITNSKRIQISAKKSTENTLSDGTGGSQKACIYSKGQLQLQGGGTLNIAAGTKHGIKSASYITIKNLMLNITSTVGDGINCEEYLQMKSGTVTMSGIGDDGIQCDLDGTTSTGETTDHEDEDSGNIYIEGGTLNLNISAAAAKGIKAAGDLNVSEGTVSVTTTGGGVYDSDERDAKGCAALKSDGNMSISGGTLTLKSQGSGGKCIKADGTLDISGGYISATSTGSLYRYTSSLTASAKAIKSEGAMTISGGEVVASSASHEGIESKSTLTITGGYVYASASDDAINTAGDFTISGGYVYGNSSGNDGLDANGNFYIKGGNVFAIAARQPEVGIDANTEQQKQLYITGGNIVAIGGLESGSSLTGVTAKSASYTKGANYALYSGSTLAFAYKVPSNSSMGTSMVVVTSGTPSLMSGITTGGTSFWSGYGFTSASGGSNVTLSTYSSGGGGNQPGGGGPGGGGPGGRW